MIMFPVWRTISAYPPRERFAGWSQDLRNVLRWSCELQASSKYHSSLCYYISTKRGYMFWRLCAEPGYWGLQWSGCFLHMVVEGFVGWLVDSRHDMLLFAGSHMASRRFERLLGGEVGVMSTSSRWTRRGVDHNRSRASSRYLVESAHLQAKVERASELAPVQVSTYELPV